MTALHLYYRSEPERNRWLPGDRLVRPIVRRIVRGPKRLGGVDRVFLNLCKGLELIGQPYSVNAPFRLIKSKDRVGVLGRGRYCLEGYNIDHPIVAGIGLMTHPSEWPTLLHDYPVVKYLQHSEWAAEVYRPYFGHAVELWPVGIDTAIWKPRPLQPKATDVLVYDKIMWDYESQQAAFRRPILEELDARGLTYEIVRYGEYQSVDYQAALARSKAMLFLCEHES